MPNGHGAIPRFGSPLLILLVTFLLLWWARSQAALLPQVLAVVAAGIFGWRLAFHMTMWNVSEYDGRYSSEEQVANSKRRYRVALFTLIPLFVLLTLILITARPAHSETVTLEELRNAGLQGLPAEGSSKAACPIPREQEYTIPALPEKTFDPSIQARTMRSGCSMPSATTTWKKPNRFLSRAATPMSKCQGRT